MANTYALTAPDYGATKTVKPRVKSMKFGDGYEQSVPDGFNTLIETWSLTWTGKTRTQIDAIDTFLANEAGATWFNWTTPQGVSKKFKCREWSPSYNNDYDCSLSATFEQVYAL